MPSLFRHPSFRKHVSQLWKFAIAGGIGSMIDIGSLTLLVQYGQLDPKVAFIPSTLMAVVVVFLINKHFTFANKEKRYASQAMKFALVYGVAVTLNIVMSTGFYWIGERILSTVLPVVALAVLSKMGAIAVGALWNYTLSHGFVFKKKEEAEPVIL